MKDDDTKTLEDMYDSVAGNTTKPIFLTESVSEVDEFITEGLINSLGGKESSSAMDIARKITAFTKKIDAVNNDKVLCKEADQILAYVTETTTNPMINRTLSMYKDMSPISKIVLLHNVLSI